MYLMGSIPTYIIVVRSLEAEVKARMDDKETCISWEMGLKQQIADLQRQAKKELQKVLDASRHHPISASSSGLATTPKEKKSRRSRSPSRRSRHDRKKRSHSPRRSSKKADGKDINCQSFRLVNVKHDLLSRGQHG